LKLYVISQIRYLRFWMIMRLKVETCAIGSFPTLSAKQSKNSSAVSRLGILGLWIAELWGPKISHTFTAVIPKIMLLQF
jgi:hypothetical protein